MSPNAESAVVVVDDEARLQSWLGIVFTEKAEVLVAAARTARMKERIIMVLLVGGIVGAHGQTR
jgi:hypothetical protein